LGWAWNLECVLSYAFLFAGMCVFMRRRFNPPEAWFAAMAFTFCGFNLLHFVHVNAIAVIAHVPWLLYGIDRLASRRTDFQSVPMSGVHQTPCPKPGGVQPSIVLIALLTGSQLLVGYPQYVLYSLIAEALFLALAIRERHEADGWRGVTVITAPWILAKLIGLALGAVQVLPTFEALADAARQNAESSFSTWGSLHPLNAVQLVAPYLFAKRVVGQNTHELALYVGIVPLLLATLAISNRRLLHDRPKLQTVSRFAAALVALGGLLALGDYGPLHRLVSAVPLLSSFRFPCRATVLVQLGVALLAAVGFALVYRGQSRDRRAVLIPRKAFAGLLFASLTLAGFAPVVWSDYVASPQQVWCGPALLLIGLLLLYGASTGRRGALPALVIFASMDLGIYGLSYGVYRAVAPLDDFIDATSAPAADHGVRVALDIAPANGEGIHVGNQILLRGFSRIDGYAGLEPARRLDYRTIDALRLAGVKYVASTAPVEVRWGLQKRANGWLEVPGPSPRARLERPDFGTATTASADTGHVQVIEDRPGRIVVVAETRNPAVIALTETYHTGWQASLGGASVSTLRVHGDFLGCAVPAGRSTVPFHFAPASLQIGRAMSVCGLGFLGLLIAISRRTR
jgi:hypothetical protein